MLPARERQTLGMPRWGQKYVSRDAAYASREVSVGQTALRRRFQIERILRPASPYRVR